MFQFTTGKLIRSFWKWWSKYSF